MTVCRLLSNDEFRELHERRLADGLPMRDVFPPGFMWSMPWVWDPISRAAELPGIRARVEANPKAKWLSLYFWRSWADKRPPLCVVCPDGSQWVVDAGSTNGLGWEVAGVAPTITCSPSIVVPGYHGFLRDGVFTPDLDGRAIP